MYGPKDISRGALDELYEYIDNVTSGIARMIDSKAMLTDGSSIPARDISLAGRKIINLRAPDGASDAANKEYVDSRLSRHYITVWAETKGPLSDGKFEWGFGAAVKYNRRAGYVMLAPGAVHHIGLSGGSTNSESKVRVAINSVDQGDEFSVTKPPTNRSAVRRFVKPLLVHQGDVINFVSVVQKGLDSDAESTVVSLLIEVRL